jgi:hypothetical protein
MCVDKMHLNKADPEHDIWSVAVIILEIILGTEFVIQADTYKKVEAVYYNALPFLDVKLRSILHDMLIDGNADEVFEYVASAEFDEEDIIAQSARRFDAAAKEHVSLQEQLASFNGSIKGNADSYRKSHGLTSKIIVRL